MSLLLGQCSQGLNGENVAPTPEPYYSVSSSTPRRSAPQVQVGCSQQSPLQEQVWQGGATRTWVNISRKPSLVGGTGCAADGGHELYSSP